MEPAHLHLVNPQTGEVVDGCPRCEAQAASFSKVLVARDARITELKNENARLMGVEPEADDIMDVLTHWRRWCMPGASVVVGSDRWVTVRALLRMKDAETGEPAYTPLSLKAAAIGAKLSDWHVQHKHLDIFKAKKGENLTAKIDGHIARAIDFKKRSFGVSALTIVDELDGESLRWLAERCRGTTPSGEECGALWIEHLRGGPTWDGCQPCERTGCETFDFSAAVVSAGIRALELRAETDPAAKEELEYVRWLHGWCKERSETNPVASMEWGRHRPKPKREVAAS